MQQSQNDEVVGKIFVALSQDIRQCLTCDGVFTRQGAADHSDTYCFQTANVLSLALATPQAFRTT
jgi:hypothetical protein